MLNIILATE